MRLVGEGAWGEPKSRDHAHTILRTAVTSGINFIDTADAYGPEIAEELIYEALHPYPANLVIATKGGITHQGPAKAAPVGRPEYLHQCVEMSLRRLHLDTHSALPTASHRSPGADGRISRQARLVTRTG